MESHETISLETVLGLAEKLSAAEKLKLVERVLVDLEPIVQAQEPKKGKPLRRKGKEQSLADEQIKEIERKIWGPMGKDPSRRIVQLQGLWKDAPLNLTDKEFRQIRHELSEALKRRAEKAL
ncbi:MAG TPA: hypothetical protein VKK81_08730 [Candidatus Binatia bacterium]|nr:hypothetical protein [Candidatus Binatia bacterium]